MSHATRFTRVLVALALQFPGLAAPAGAIGPREALCHLAENCLDGVCLGRACASTGGKVCAREVRRPACHHVGVGPTGVHQCVGSPL